MSVPAALSLGLINIDALTRSLPLPVLTARCDAAI